MRRILLTLLALATLSTTGSALAQTTQRPHSLEQGSWALLYQLDGLRLTFFDGMLAFKYHLTGRKAFRFGLGGNASTNHDREVLNGGISTEAHYLLYLRPEREVKFYLGAGPFVGYNLNRRNIDATTSRRNERWMVGVGGRLGTEWFATESISVLAEFGNLFATSTTMTRDGADEETWRDYSYRNSVIVGLSVYL